MSEQKKEAKAVKGRPRKKPQVPIEDKKIASGEPGRRSWSRKLTPAQIRVVCERYHAGSNVREIMKEFNVSRSSLYRYLEDYGQTPDSQRDAAYWRIECQRMKDLAMDLMLENKELRAQIPALKRKT